MERVIWNGNDVWNYDEADREDWWQEMCETNGWDKDNCSIKEDEWYDEIISYLDTEKENLDVILPDGKKVIGFAELGLWNGMKKAFRLFSENINSIFSYSEELAYTKWYANEDREIIEETCHHDGTNIIEFRVVSADVADALKNGAISANTAYDRSTSLYPYIAHVYGWSKGPGRQPASYGTRP